ncbi:TetR/AcrR family transcriptional regulator [Nocardia colli]|uniref:TetR/AcrR family transcriptional regulator n=1 Tax=Nocardia colli TaxID=2545717 RepID=A0A5N0E6T5_9NOCA|nr:TetR family transcriptional regulator [Nocardia colli]KAA8883844.1 TetR/AcrR family transcriptional regulator [Nocardia colli]
MDDPTTPRSRKPRDRARTESDLFDAVERLLERDGVLAGLNLNEVAAEAKVNRGQIYQMYGSRQELLRATMTHRFTELAPQFPGHWDLPFIERRRRLMQAALTGKWMSFAALLALDGDDKLALFTEPDEQRAALQRDKAYGALPEEVDAEALNVLTAATVAGYVIFRDMVARDIGVPVAELDERITAAYEYLLERVTKND